jgi:hypothetical protein
MSLPHRLRAVACFQADRLRLQPDAEALTKRLLHKELPWWPLHVGEEHDYNGRTIRVFTEQLGERNWYALSWDLRFGEVRLVFVRDRIPDKYRFLRELNPSIERATDAAIRMVCYEA